jgi:hypothetical protein
VSTARSIITGAMTFHLNVLSPGEALEADTAEVCRTALNSIVDEISGGKSMLWRQVLTTGTVTGATGSLGSTWALPVGDQILDATYTDGGEDTHIPEITFQQYSKIPNKFTVGTPRYWAHDGNANLYFCPTPTALQITLRTQGNVSEFADLDTDYTLPKGYLSALQAMLAEKLAPSMLGDVPPAVARAARIARLKLRTQMEPEILHCSGGFFLTASG